MKKIFPALAFLMLVVAASATNAGTRVSLGSSYGRPQRSCRAVYAYPVVVKIYSHYQYKRLPWPYYARAYFKHAAGRRFVVQGSY